VLASVAVARRERSTSEHGSDLFALGDDLIGLVYGRVPTGLSGANGSEEPLMHAVIGRVKIRPGHEDETRAMIASHGVAMLNGMIGSSGGYWSRTGDGADVIQHSFWLFDTEDNARAAEATFSSLRDMPDAPATFVSVDVCEIIGQA
jgi:hypothetical protein